MKKNMTSCLTVFSTLLTGIRTEHLSSAQVGFCRDYVLTSSPNKVLYFVWHLALQIVFQSCFCPLAPEVPSCSIPAAAIAIQ